MRVGKLIKGAVIDVGDRIKREQWSGVKWFPITRVTEKFAFFKWNEKAECKLRRVVLHDGFARQAGKADTWDNISMTVWRPIPNMSPFDGSDSQAF